MGTMSNIGNDPQAIHAAVPSVVDNSTVSHTIYAPNPNTLHLTVRLIPEKTHLSFPFSKATSWDRFVQTLYKLYSIHNPPHTQCSLPNLFSCLRITCGESGAQILPQFWSELLRPAMAINVELLPPFKPPPWGCAKTGFGIDDEDVVMTTPTLTGDVRGLLQYSGPFEDALNKINPFDRMFQQKGLPTPGSPPGCRPAVSPLSLPTPLSAKPTDSFPGFTVNAFSVSNLSSKLGPWSQCSSDAMIVEQADGGLATSTAAEAIRSNYTMTPQTSFGSPECEEMVTSHRIPSVAAIGGAGGSATADHGLHHNIPQSTPLANGSRPTPPTVNNKNPLATQTTPPPSPFMSAPNTRNKKITSATTAQTTPKATGQSSSAASTPTSNKRKRDQSEDTVSVSASENGSASSRPSSSGRNGRQSDTGSSVHADEEQPISSPKRPRHTRSQSNNNINNINNHQLRNKQKNQAPSPATAATINNNNYNNRNGESKRAAPQRDIVVVERALLLDSLAAGEFIKIVRAKDGSLIALREEEDYEVAMERRKSETKLWQEVEKERVRETEKERERTRKREREDDMDALIRIWSGGGSEPKKQKKPIVFDKLTAEDKIRLQKLVRENFIIRIDHLTAPFIEDWRSKNLPTADNEEVNGYIVDVANTVYNTELKRQSAYRSFLELQNMSQCRK